MILDKNDDGADDDVIVIRARLVVKVPSRLILLPVADTEPPQLFPTVNDVVMMVKMPQPPATMLVVSPPYQRLGVVFWRNNQSPCHSY
jgi:hypothetical protein